MKCVGNSFENCDKDAKFIRHTQFAGYHPLCEKHAVEDLDFMIDNSYQSWEKI